jgi:hypothetical protein
VTISAKIEIPIVSHSRSPITCVTGCRYSIAMPKSPCTASVAHFQYCTQIGRSRPYWIRRFSASCCETTLPLAASCAMYEST